MNELIKFCESNNSRVLRKWVHYFKIYERYFSKFRGEDIVIIEIGVFKGGSLQMWSSYFGPRARIIGIDIDPACKQYEENNIEIYIGSQADQAFITDLFTKVPRPDIILDDGGHFVRQQIRGLEYMYPYLKPGGIYLCEDVHTSYWLKYGGGYRRKGTFIEYMKSKVDQLNSWHFENKKRIPDYFNETAYNISFYDSVVVIEKELLEPPVEKWFGKPEEEVPVSPMKTWKKIPVFILDMTNKILQYLRLPSIYYGR
jgi:hypothetical protein